MENTFEISTFFLIFILFTVHTIFVSYIVSKISNSYQGSNEQFSLSILLLIELSLVALILTLIMI